jgi:hypothetical protein
MAVLCAALVICSCSKDIKNNDAVREGVVDYLTKRTGQTGLDMKLMDVSVTNVAYNNNEATATVTFKPKAGGSEGMSMNYVLERQGSKWVVKGRKESGGSAHGAGMGGTMPGMQAPGGAMGGGQAPAMPPNHPPVKQSNPSEKK